MADPGREDRGLVEAFLRDRDEDAFRTLYRRHSPVMYGVVLRLVRGDAGEAEEVLQSAWIRAAERLDTFRWESTLRSWLTGVAVNCFREFTRRRKRITPMDPAMLPELEVPPSRVARPIVRIDLERAIDRLPDGYRQVLLLHDVQGYTHREIGEMMGIQDGTSKSQLSRARRAVRFWLQKTEETDERRAS